MWTLLDSIVTAGVLEGRVFAEMGENAGVVSVDDAVETERMEAGVSATSGVCFAGLTGNREGEGCVVDWSEVVCRLD